MANDVLRDRLVGYFVDALGRLDTCFHDFVDGVWVEITRIAESDTPEKIYGDVQTITNFTHVHHAQKDVGRLAFFFFLLFGIELFSNTLSPLTFSLFVEDKGMFRHILERANSFGQFVSSPSERDVAAEMFLNSVLHARPLCLRANRFSNLIDCGRFHEMLCDT